MSIRKLRFVKVLTAAVTIVALARGVSAQVRRSPTSTASSSSAPTTSAPASSSAPIDAGAQLSSHAIVLPGGPGLIRMDFLGYDAASHSVWIPAGNTGRVDILDTANEAVRAISGFATATTAGRNGPRIVGPSSVAIGTDVVFVGNRADSQVCPIDPHTLRRGDCFTLESPPDGIVLVPAMHQLWVTMPRIHALAMLAVNGMTRPTLAARLVLDGSPEGYAVDSEAAIFYTNLEDRDRTLAINARTHAVVNTYSPGCGEEGPHGLAIDTARHQLFVACDDRVVVLDLAHAGAVVGSAITGGGVDLIDYAPGRHLLFVASAGTAMLRVVNVDEHGAMRIVASAPTVAGARNAVVDERGRAYVADTAGGRIFVTQPPP